MKSKIIAFLLVIALPWLPLAMHAQIAVSFDASNPADSPNLVGFSAGFNHRYMVVKNGNVWGTQVRPELIDAFANIKKPLMRFPGGVIGNFYHLYPDGFDCPGSNAPCVNNFAPGYGLRNVETVTHLASVNGEQTFEDGNTIDDNWIVVLANLADAYKARTGDDLEIMYMANVVGHFKFGNQNSVFDSSDPRFQRLLNETKDALRYLIGTRQLKVVGVELGTELYGSHWANNNDMDVDSFISLIPHYRALVDDIETEFSLGYNIPVAVPVSHNSNLGPSANNFTGKLVDQTYYPAQDYDAWVIHDYQDIIPACDKLNCNQCSDWVFDECELNKYASLDQPTFLANLCGPAQDDEPEDSVMQSVFEGRKGMLADTFHHGIADDLQLTLQDMRGLSGKASGKAWITEWNLKMDGGCRDGLLAYNWKAVNQFFGNTLYHSMSLFEWLHSFYEADASATNGFAEFASVHSFFAANRHYPIFKTNVGNNTFSRNASSFAFALTSELNSFSAQKITVSAPVDNDSLVFHAYIDPGAGSNDLPVYLYYSNKSPNPQTLTLPASLNFTYSLNTQASELRYVSGANLYAASNGDYAYGTTNFNDTEIDTANAFTPQIISGPVTLPGYSFGFVKLDYSQTGLGVVNASLGKLKVFPNPFLDQIELEVEGGRSEAVVIELVDPIGRILQKKQGQVPGSYQFNAESLPAGFYGLRIRNASTGNLRYAKPVLKMKN